MFRNLLVILVFLATVPYGFVAEKANSTGKFIDIQQKTHEKVDMYLVNTPVTTAVPYFQVAAEFGDMDYVAEYTPRHSGEELPEAWRVGESVQGRADKHHLYLQRPNGTEMQLVIIKRIPVSKEKSQQ
jgi:hypothetical protein